MDIEKLQEFFFWCMVINMGIYSFSVVSVLVLRDMILKIHVKMFGLDEETVKRSIYMYLAVYKLLIIVFNFVPWVVMLIINRN